MWTSTPAFSPLRRRNQRARPAQTRGLTARSGLAGLASATGRSIQDVAVALRQLVDLNIVEAIEDEYSVTPPIQMTVLRTEKGLSRGWYEKAYRRLEAEYWSRDNSLPPISVVDATLRAGLRIGRHATDGYKSLVRPSLLINAAEELYHQRDYRQALVVHPFSSLVYASSTLPV